MKPVRKLNPAAERERQARLRERRKNDGWRRVTVWLTPQEAANLERMGGDAWLGRTVKGLLTDALDDAPRKGRGQPQNRRKWEQPLVSDTATPTPPEPETFTLAPVPETAPAASDGPQTAPGTPHDRLMALVDALQAQGLSGADIARQLNDEGHRTPTGAELRGPNLLRDWRKWKGANHAGR